VTPVAECATHVIRRSQEQRFTGVDLRFTALDQKVGNLDRKLETGFLWMVGVQFATLIAIVASFIAR
jgi:hypothetical protein